LVNSDYPIIIAGLIGPSYLPKRKEKYKYPLIQALLASY
jgi:hypothetical protein